MVSLEGSMGHQKRAACGLTRGQYGYHKREVCGLTKGQYMVSQE